MSSLSDRDSVFIEAKYFKNRLISFAGNQHLDTHGREVPCSKLARTSGVKIVRRNKENLIHAKGEPAVEFNNGVKWWVEDGVYHRADGPAIETSGANGNHVDKLQNRKNSLMTLCGVRK